ncbi:thioredoxin domain-containing protein 15 [Anopheles gambiae]|uniref:thioredoxin domain-containing protein 15 n=1 Tax=Anopheles coluzzii TaxID=1518534 RepID=UPI0020FFA338|nr:thioredoxin domain-containing protein 15 [Anopheles coluzzii]XP_309959.4 thioredoxin domain-containing protein 15 [Anopheles gambiae]
MKPVLLSLAFLLVVNSAVAFRFKGLEFYMQLWNGEFLESNSFGGDNVAKVAEKAEAVVEKKAPVVFVYKSGLYDYLTYWDKGMCSLDQGNDQDDSDGGRKSPLRVNCTPLEGNGTLYIITSLQDIVKGLSPHAAATNATNRNEVNNCFLMLFYTKTCIHSAMVAPHFNALARHFPDLMVTAIDAHNFHFLNAEFGIVGLPTIMLFHQGRPLVRYNGTEMTLLSLAKFVTRHTGIEPRLVNQKSGTATVLHYISDDFKGPLSNKVEHRTDYWLYVAWAFILVCLSYYFSKSTLYAQIVEMIKRNWRESAAQHG